jgi:hypothetical protein
MKNIINTLVSANSSGISVNVPLNLNIHHEINLWKLYLDDSLEFVLGDWLWIYKCLIFNKL